MKKVISLTLPNALVDAVKGHFGIDNTSQAIQRAVSDAMLGTFTKISHNHDLIYEHFSTLERRNTSSFSVRLDSWAIEALCRVTRKTRKDAVTDALLTSLYIPQKKECELGESLKTIRVLGSKWSPSMQNAIGHILKTSKRDWEISVETCAGALGILANHKVAKQEVINDDDLEKINFYKCVQCYTFELICKCLLFDLTPKTFDKLRKQHFELSSTPNVDQAVRYYLLNTCSVRNSGNTFYKVTDETFFKKVENIARLHQRIQNVEIVEKDIFDIVKKYRNSSNSLLYLDPIYIDTNVYAQRKIRHAKAHGASFDLAEHQKLAKMLRTIQGDFIYFCRITASRTKNNKNKIVLTSEELKKADTILKGKIDDFYSDYGFYKKDVPIKDGVVERIITNFKFDGAIPYKCEGGDDNG